MLWWVGRPGPESGQPSAATGETVGVRPASQAARSRTRPVTSRARVRRRRTTGGVRPRHARGCLPEGGRGGSRWHGGQFLGPVVRLARRVPGRPCGSTPRASVRRRSRQGSRCGRYRAAPVLGAGACPGGLQPGRVPRRARARCTAALRPAVGLDDRVALVHAAVVGRHELPRRACSARRVNILALSVRCASTWPRDQPGRADACGDLLVVQSGDEPSSVPWASITAATGAGCDTGSAAL